MRRGEIYWIDWNPARGSEQAGRRPAVVISSDQANRALPVVTVAAITRTIREGSPIAMVLEAGEPLPFRSSILSFQVMTIDKHRLLDLAGELSTVQLAELATTMRKVWGL